MCFLDSILFYSTLNAQRRKIDEDRQCAKWLCAMRITTEQCERFEAAMARFRRNATPLQDWSIEKPYTRPDGKPCQSESIDATGITFQWAGTKGVEIAVFYTGCDEQEFREFYDSALAVAGALPIRGLVARD